jgi:hydrogenase maturation protease
MNKDQILLIGYGNPGRCDDGLGPALAQRIEDRELTAVSVEVDYQLTVEDAHTVAQHGICIFADADVSGPEPFRFNRVPPAKDLMSFTSHGVQPAQVVGLAEQLFGAAVEAYSLGIRGYHFNEFGEQLSEKAESNLKKAEEFLIQNIRNGSFAEAELVHTARN